MDTQTKQLLYMLKALAEEKRITLLRLMHQQEYSVGDLAQLVELSEPTVSHHLTRLREVGLINLRTAGTQRFYRVNESGLTRFKRLADEIEQMPLTTQPAESDESWIDKLDWPEEDRKVLRGLTHGGKLLHIPNKHKKWLVILRWLATLFQADMLYTEKDVNDILKSVFEEDYVALRRGLVDMGYLRRERGGGKYWLAPVDEEPGLAG